MFRDVAGSEFKLFKRIFDETFKTIHQKRKKFPFHASWESAGAAKHRFHIQTTLVALRLT